MASAVDDHDEIMSGHTRKTSLTARRVENLAQVREDVQKKTFTRWSNMILREDDVIDDLFTDLKSGVRLLKLINSLAACQLKPERGMMEIHYRQNIGRALEALAKVDPHHGISISAVYEGIPKLTLALVWHLILRYSHLQHSMEQGVSAEIHCRTWCGKIADGYVGLEDIGSDFLGTWVSGLVLPALINRNNPELLDYSDLYYNKTPEERFEISFGICETKLNVPKLLDVEDMRRGKVDNQSVITYLMSLNKALTDEVPDIPPAIVELKQQVRQAQADYYEEIVEEEEELDDNEEHEQIKDERGVREDGGVIKQNGEDEKKEEYEEEEEDEEEEEEVDGKQVKEDGAQCEQNGEGEEEEELDYNEEEDAMSEDAMSEDAMSEDDLEDEDMTPVEFDEASLTSMMANSRDHLASTRSSTVTLDSEADYISATSSPLVSRKPYQDEDTTLHDIHYLEDTLKSLTNLPENISVSKQELDSLNDMFSDRRDMCLTLQGQISDQLNSKQDREKRAELHQLLSQTARFHDALNSATTEIDDFLGSLAEFESAVALCEDFAADTESDLSVEQIPSSATESQIKLGEQRQLQSRLEDRQRNLEFSFRSLARAVPRTITISIHEQQKSVTVLQNRLNDIEAVLNGSVETLEFLCSRLPSLQQKLDETDEIISRVEEEVADSNPDHIQLLIIRAKTHLTTVDNLFLAIESFDNEFNLDVLRADWTNLSERCTSCDEVIQERLLVEEQLSEEVIAIADWADMLEVFLQRKMKPLESRKQLKEVQGKWKEVADDLKSKCEEIETLLQSDYSTQDLRVMSPLDKDTLLSLKHQLTSLQTPLQTRREILQEAFSGWGTVETLIKSVSQNMMELEFKPSRDPPLSSWAVRPMLNYIDHLVESEADLTEQAEQLQCLVQQIADLPGVLIDQSLILREREGLLTKHSILCKRSSNKRIKSQRLSKQLEPILPFLRGEYLQKVSWLYNQPLLDLESKSESCNMALQNKNVTYSDYWHVVKTIAPEKIPYLLLSWLVYAVGPWGMGCSIDRPMSIYDFTPNIGI